MTFVSYAQNFEDVILWRVLKEVDQGFYIDVGANDPENDSVTKAFYERGWRGINIEPIQQWYYLLELNRPRDINLNIAAGRDIGEIAIYELPDTGLSTTDQALAERHEAERGYKKHKKMVPVDTLTSICEKYHVGLIHFLKIDVEGAEKDVLDGLDLTRIRPWIVVLESTLPNTQVVYHEKWEPILTQAHYEFVYFDGLNRFYVAQEQAVLKLRFNSPPNVFDSFVSRHQWSAELKAQAAQNNAAILAEKVGEITAELKAQRERAQATEAELRAQRERAQATEAELRAQRERAQATEAELRAQREHVNELNNQIYHRWLQTSQLEGECNALRQSISWRITAPLRFAAGLIRHPSKTLRRSINHVVHQFIIITRRPLSALMAAVLRRPRLASRINEYLLRYPSLHAQLRGIVADRNIEALESRFAHQGSEARMSVPDLLSPSLVSRSLLMLLKCRPLVAIVHALLRPFPKLHGYAIHKVAHVAISAAQPFSIARHSGRSVSMAAAQIFLDVSGLINSDAGTGVQRVVRSLLLEMVSNPPPSFVIRPVFATLGEQGYRHAGERVAHIYGVGDANSGVIEPQRGDIFIGLDLQHTLVMQNASYFEAIREIGVRVHFVVYDLLPIQYPSYFRPEMASLHQKWLKAISQADGVLCISRTVAKEYEAWLVEKVPDRVGSLVIQHFPLGADLPLTLGQVEFSDTDPAALSPSNHQPAFLMVGTIEPRKGHALVLAAVEQLWRNGLDIHLIIVGKIGWMMDGFVAQLKAHPRRGQHLHWLADADDRVLALAYQRASALIAASECEGYGLPLIEAARYGVPVIARDIDPFREIAEKTADFFDRDATPNELAAHLQAWLDSRGVNHHQRFECVALSSWSQSARQLIERVLPFAGQYLARGDSEQDGHVTVEEVLLGIRQELAVYREAVE